MPEVKANDDKHIFQTIRSEVDAAFNQTKPKNDNIMLDLLKEIYYRSQPLYQKRDSLSKNVNDNEYEKKELYE